MYKESNFGILIDLSYYMKLSYGIYFLDSCKWQEDNHIRIDEVANFRYIFIFVEFDLTLEYLFLLYTCKTKKTFC